MAVKGKAPPSLEELQSMIDEVPDDGAIHNNVVNLPKPTPGRAAQEGKWKEHLMDLLVCSGILIIGIIIGVVGAAIYLKIHDTGCSKAVNKLMARGYYTEARALDEQYRVCADDNQMIDACLDMEYLKRHPAILLWPKLPGATGHESL